MTESRAGSRPFKLSMNFRTKMPKAVQTSQHRTLNRHFVSTSTRKAPAYKFLVSLQTLNSQVIKMTPSMTKDRYERSGCKMCCQVKVSRKEVVLMSQNPLPIHPLASFPKLGGKILIACTARLLAIPYLRAVYQHPSQPEMYQHLI